MIDKVQKIREEVERLKKETSIGLSEWENGVENGRMEIIDALSSFIDSIQEEPKKCMYAQPNYTNGDRLVLCEDCNELCKYNPKTAAESLGISHEVYDKIVDECIYGKEPEMVDVDDSPKKEPVSKDLDEAAELYTLDDSIKPWRNLTKEAFKAGANWQKQQMIDKAIDWLKSNIGYKEWIMEFRKHLED